MAQATAEPAVVDIRGLAAMIDIGLSTAFRYRSLGKLPKPLGLSQRKVRWSVTDLKAWIDAGCPDQRTWERIRNVAR